MQRWNREPLVSTQNTNIGEDPKLFTTYWLTNQPKWHSVGLESPFHLESWCEQRIVSAINRLPKYWFEELIGGSFQNVQYGPKNDRRLETCHLRQTTYNLSSLTGKESDTKSQLPESISWLLMGCVWCAQAFWNSKLSSDISLTYTLPQPNCHFITSDPQILVWSDFGWRHRGLTKL